MRFITVERESDSQLKRDVWRFYYDDRRHALVLDSWTAQARDTKRHKFKSVASWDRHYQRHNTVERPPMPDDVIGEALTLFTNTLVVEPLSA